MKQSISADHQELNAEQAPSNAGGYISHPMQQKIDASPRQSAQQARVAQLQSTAKPGKSNGLPAQLRAGIEALSGMDMSHVQVHRNSAKPAQLNAMAYAQGNQIHLGPGQEKHLPHEAWHVVQQAQGRVAPTMQMAGAAVNDNPALEREADVMGAKALGLGTGVAQAATTASMNFTAPPFRPMAIQLRSYFHGRSESTSEAKGAPLQIQNMFARTTLDFDPTGKGGFYMAHAGGVASNWAQTKAKRYRDDAKESGEITSNTRPIPTLYSYEVDDEALKPLMGISWATRRDALDEIRFVAEEGRQAWQKFVLRSRENRNPHSADYVQGPMISNPEVAAAIVRLKQKEKGSKLEDHELDAIATEEVRWHTGGDQTAIYTDKAKAVFQSGFRERALLPFDDPEYRQVELGVDLTKGDRAEVGRKRLEHPEFEDTIVLKLYRQSLRRSIIKRFTQEFDKKDVPELTNILMEYEALGDLVDTRLSLQVLELAKLAPQNQEYVSDAPKFADFTLAESDFRVLAGLLRGRAVEVTKRLGWTGSDMEYLKLGKGDFVAAYNIRRACEQARVPYLPKFETAALGPLLGTGKKKVAYEIAGDRNAVLVKMKEFDFFRLIGNEVGMLSVLARAGVPVIGVIGITLHAGVPAIIMPRMAEQSKDFKADLDEHPDAPVPEGKLRRKGKLISKARYFKPETLKTLVQIQEQLTKAQLRVSDLQFLISADGKIVVADPRKIQEDQLPTEGNIGTINHTLAAGILALLDLDRVPREGVSYKKVYAAIVELTGLSPLTDQADDILSILESKYDVPLIHDDEGVGKRKPLTSERDPLASAASSSLDASSSKPPPTTIEDWKRIVLTKLSESTEMKVPGKPSKIQIALKFVAVPDSTSDAVTGRIFNLTSSQFFEAFKVLNNKTGPKITYDKTGIYLLPD
jgi:hypothetical protein